MGIWRPLKVGAGGLISNIQFANDGTAVIRTDTYGAYVWDSVQNQWRQLFLSTSIPSGTVLNAFFGGLSQGCYSVAIAPSNSSRIYMMVTGYILRSDDKGKTFTNVTNSAYTRVTDTSPNDNNAKPLGPYLLVDPNNPDICYMGTPSSGLWKTSNAGTSWSQVSVGTATSGLGHTIAFDPTSSHPGNVTQGIFVTTYGTGVYHSTDGGANWTLLNSAGMPTTHRRMIVSSTGILWFIDNPSVLHKWTAGTWSTPNIGGEAVCIAECPANGNLYASQSFNSYSASTDGGATWNKMLTSAPTRVIPAGEPIGLGDSYAPWNADVLNFIFDPNNPTRLYLAEGLGVWYMDSPPTAASSALTWTCQSRGIEQLVADQVVALPSGAVIPVSWDRALYRSTNQNAYPPMVRDLTTAIDRAAHVGYCFGTPEYLTVAMGAGKSGYSNDDGKTWTSFTAVPSGSPLVGVDGNGGSIAISANQCTPGTANLVWLGSGNNDPYYSLNGGGSWTRVVISGVAQQLGVTSTTSNNISIGSKTFTVSGGTNTFPAGASVFIYQTSNPTTQWMVGTITSFANPTLTVNITSVVGSSSGVTDWTISTETGWGTNPNFNHIACCPDGKDLDTFYLHNYGPGAQGAAGGAGVFKSTNKGASFTLVSNSGAGGNLVNYNYDLFHSKIKPVPGRSGELFYCTGPIGGGSYPTPPINTFFMRTTDHAATWSQVTGFLDVWDFGFGAPAPGGTYPAIYVVGYYDSGSGSTYGIWASDDNAGSWTNIATYPFAWLDSVVAIDGDKSVYRRVYIGFTGSGFGFFGVNSYGFLGR